VECPIAPAKTKWNSKLFHFFQQSHFIINLYEEIVLHIYFISGTWVTIMCWRFVEYTILWHNDYTPSCIILLVFLITQSPLFDSISWRINWKFVIILQKANNDIILGSEVARELDTLVNKMKNMREKHFHTQILYYSCLVCKTITKQKNVYPVFYFLKSGHPNELWLYRSK
jgi:hypothetical protein